MKNPLVNPEAPAWINVAATGIPVSDRVKATVLKADIGTMQPLADRTLHPDAARQALTLKQTLPSDWNGLMELSWSGAVAYWTPTGGTPIVSGSVFSNALLPQIIYLEGDGCGTNEAVFSVVGLDDCKTNLALSIFGMNTTLAGVAEADELAPGGFLADRSVHTNAPRTLLTLAACGPVSATGAVTLTWNSPVVQMYTSPTGGTALAQFSRPYNGFNGTNLYVEGIAPGSNVLSWSYSEQTNCVDNILVTVLRVGIDIQKTLLTLKHDRECNLEIKAVPVDIPLGTYRIDIKRTNSATWFVLGNNKAMTPWHANIAGRFHLRGMATINGTDCYSTNVVVANQFPDYSQIEGDSAVRSATDAEWATTLAECTSSPNQRRERGFWVQINTIINAYQFTTAFTGPWVAPTQGASANPGVTPSDVPVDSAPNASGAIYTVACFHTHTPTIYWSTNDWRGVGPSGPYSGDVPFHNNRARVGIVYDYTGNAQGRIYGGHPKNAAAQRYQVGPTRRPQP